MRAFLCVDAVAPVMNTSALSSALFKRTNESGVCMSSFRIPQPHRHNRRGSVRQLASAHESALRCHSARARTNRSMQTFLATFSRALTLLVCARASTTSPQLAQVSNPTAKSVAVCTSSTHERAGRTPPCTVLATRPVLSAGQLTISAHSSASRSTGAAHACAASLLQLQHTAQVCSTGRLSPPAARPHSP